MPASIFISYARQDGIQLASRLHHDLKKLGYAVWLDRDQIAGGASWTVAIERAIDDSDAVLAILSKGSFVSNICRAEQMRALRKSKRVVPLLADKNADRQLHLEHLNYRDFSDPTHYQSALATLLSDISAGTVAPIPQQYTRSYQQSLMRMTVPPLPPNFICRPAETTQLREFLTSDAADMRMVGIHGMGGLGKSVLAQAICHDDVIQDAFPDGIIWLSMSGAALLDNVREAGRALADPQPNYDTLPSGSGRIRMLLEQKAALLVLDDVVAASELEPFRTAEWSAPRVRILFTTRDRSVGLPWAATVLPLELFSEPQSVELLKKWAKREDPSYQEIAKRLGNLPLALKIAGAVLSENVSGQQWLSEVETISEIKLDRYSNDARTNLEACFDVSLARLPEGDRNLFYALGAFPKGSRTPFRLIAALWRSVDPKLNTNNCKEIGRALARRALIDMNGDRVSQHDLLWEYAAERLAGKPSVRTLIDGLAKALEEDHDWVIRELAAKALRRIGDSSALDALIAAAAADKDIDVQLAALGALGRIADPRAIDTLIGVLQYGDLETAHEAACGLASIGEPAVMPLLAALHTVAGFRLRDGISALGWIGDPRALGDLEIWCSDDDVIETIHTIDGVRHENVAERACEAIRLKLQQ